MSRLKVVTTLALMVGFAAGAGVPTPTAAPSQARAAPAPPGHTFARVRPDWRLEVSLLRSDDEDPPDSFTVVRPENRDPAFTGYLTEKRYFEGGKTGEARKILRYGPAGRLVCEIDNVGDEQHSRRFHLDGRLASYLHWRAGKWLNGHGVSPDGKVRYRLVDGAGETISWGRRPGNYRHSWYHRGHLFLSKRYRGGRHTEARLNGQDDSCLIVRPGQETLHLAGEVWTRAEGRPPSWHKLGEWPIDPGWPGPRRAKPTRSYERARADFVRGYDRLLKDAGHAWEKLGIALIRSGESWPGERPGR
jgi:hypothetical protein